MPHGVVVMLDVLGVTGMWARSSPDAVANKVNAWQTVLGVFRGIGEDILESGIVDRCQVYAFSDTIFITVEGKPAADLGESGARPQPRTANLLLLTGLFLADAFITAMRGSFFFRGAIAVGDFYEGASAATAQPGAPHLSQPLLLGPAIDNAAEWYEQADWIGVLVTPSASYILDHYVHLQTSPDAVAAVRQVFERFPIPLKQGREGGTKDRQLWALAWPRRAAEVEGDPRAARAWVLEAFAEEPIGIAPMSKYENTLSFFNSCLNLPDGAPGWESPPLGRRAASAGRDPSG